MVRADSAIVVKEHKSSVKNGSWWMAGKETMLVGCAGEVDVDCNELQILHERLQSTSALHLLSTLCLMLDADRLGATATSC